MLCSKIGTFCFQCQILCLALRRNLYDSILHQLLIIGLKMTTKEQQQRQEMVLPSFFYAIASSESRQLISLDELQRIITLDAMTQARTEDYRKNMRISSELAHQTKVMMPGITTSVLMDGRGKELRNVVKTTQMIAVDIDKIPAEKMKEVVQKADADPHTMMRFITVSQRGLRIISRYLPIDDDEVTAL